MRSKRFEIWTADLNPRIGTEPGKVRPVLVLQTDLLNTVHPSTVVCPLTTKVAKGSEILRVHVKKGIAGLSHASDIMIDQVREIDNKRLISKLGELSHDLSVLVLENIKIVLDIE